MASSSSLRLTFGSGIRFMMESRPETDTTAAGVVIPALSTHSLMPSLTTAGCLILPSAMTSRGNVTMACDFRAYPPFVGTSSAALIDRDPMSSPKIGVLFLRPNSAMRWLPASPPSGPTLGPGIQYFVHGRPWIHNGVGAGSEP